MTRFALTLEFDGTPFMGLQRQDHGPTVQQVVEDALAQITGEKAVLFSAGRTDSGVHARAMRSHAELEKDITPFRLSEALNAVMRPHPIAVIGCEVVPDDWHARFSCIGRTYQYRIRNRRAPLTLEKNKAWHVARPLDAQAMHKAAQALVGQHDFTTFRSAHCQAQSPVKSIDSISVRREDDLVMVDVAARSFLHHQVRSIVGCLSMVGTGQWETGRIAQILAAADRSQLGLNAPPDGLYFMRAIYPGE